MDLRALGTIRRRLADLERRLDRVSHAAHDPVSRARAFADPAEREVAAFFAAALAYGRVGSILASLDALFRAMRGRPLRFLRRGSPRAQAAALAGFRHRFHTGSDLAALSRFLGRVLSRHGSIEAWMCAHRSPGDEDVGAMLEGASGEFRAGALAAVPSGCGPGRSDALWTFLPAPSGGSACKRMCLFLRWMARRDDGVDLGLWRRLPASALVVPLDTHVFRLLRALGVVRHRSPGWSAAIEATRFLRRLDPRDPLRFEFALAHLGISGAYRAIGPAAEVSPIRVSRRLPALADEANRRLRTAGIRTGRRPQRVGVTSSPGSSET